MKHADSKSGGFIEIGPVVPEISITTDRQTNRHCSIILNIKIFHLVELLHILAYHWSYCGIEIRDSSIEYLDIMKQSKGTQIRHDTTILTDLYDVMNTKI